MSLLTESEETVQENAESKKFEKRVIYAGIIYMISQSTVVFTPNRSLY